MENTSEKIMSVMSTIFEVPLSAITKESSIDNVDTWDSLHHLNLILALEEEFNVSIPDEEVGNLVDYNTIEKTINELAK